MKKKTKNSQPQTKLLVPIKKGDLFPTYGKSYKKRFQ